MTRRIAFLLPDMADGGTERLTIDLMAGALARGFAVDLVLMRRTGAFLALVPPGVRVIDLRTTRILAALAPLRRYLAAHRPDGLIAMMWPLTTMAVLAVRSLRQGLRPRLIVADHCSLTRQYAHSRRTLAAIRLTLTLTYRFADGVVAVSEGLADEIAALARLDRSRVSRIYNPVGPPLRSAVDPAALWPAGSARRILAVGSFKAQKNHALLVEAFAMIAQQRPAVLAIVGKGTLAPQLSAQIAAAGLADAVCLPGFTPTPGDWYAGAELFVLSSDYEGFGNVLVEALHAGLPVVSTDCISGPSEVLGGGQWGQLVPPGNAAALAQAMGKTLDAPVDRAAQQARASEFSVDRAVAAYCALLFPQ